LGQSRTVIGIRPLAQSAGEAASRLSEQDPEGASTRSSRNSNLLPNLEPGPSAEHAGQAGRRTVCLVPPSGRPWTSVNPDRVTASATCSGRRTPPPHSVFRRPESVAWKSLPGTLIVGKGQPTAAAQRPPHGRQASHDGILGGIPSVGRRGRASPHRSRPRPADRGSRCDRSSLPRRRWLVPRGAAYPRAQDRQRAMSDKCGTSRLR
jgi:hypothetical protein